MKCSFMLQLLSAMRAAVESSEPSAKAGGPQTKICKYNSRWSMNSNRPGRKKNQTELSVRRFPFPEDGVRNFADQCKSDRGRVIALHIHERFDQFALIDAN